MRRSLLFSCALHGVIVLIVLATAPRRAPRESPGAAEIALDATPLPIPIVAIDVDMLAHAGGSGPAHPTEPAAAVSTRAHRRRPAASGAPAAETPLVPEPTPGLAAPPTSEQGSVEVAPAVPAPGPPDAPGGQVVGAGDGAGVGNGIGDGFGDG